jgi:GntR family transcriptional regulator/MocR family aminotransferase
LAAELGVSRTTVTAAYEQLAAEGFIEVNQGARPRVAAAFAVVDKKRRFSSERSSGRTQLSAYGERLRAAPTLPERARSELLVDFRYGNLAPTDFPTLQWKRALNSALIRCSGLLTYDEPQGSKHLRAALQGYLWRSRALRCDVDQIVIVNGSQQGLDLCARILLNPGDHFVIENPCYAMARFAFSSTGATPIPIAVDARGLNTEQLEGIEARLAYVTPSHQYPLGGVMPIGRRYQLLDWAYAASAWIIEDDYDGEYRYDISPIPPLHALEDNGRVLYVGTVSKTLSPTMRLGYLVVPAELRDVFATAKLLVDRHTSLTEQEALATLLESGAYERHIRRMRRLNSERRATLLDALRRTFGPRIDIEGADAGLHVVVWLRDLPATAEAALIEEARQLGVGLHPVSPLCDPALVQDKYLGVGLVMGYGALDPRRIERGVHLMSQAINQVVIKTQRQ